MNIIFLNKGGGSCRSVILTKTCDSSEYTKCDGIYYPFYEFEQKL